MSDAAKEAWEQIEQEWLEAGDGDSTTIAVWLWLQQRFPEGPPGKQSRGEKAWCTLGDMCINIYGGHEGKYESGIVLAFHWLMKRYPDGPPPLLREGAIS